MSEIGDYLLIPLKRTPENEKNLAILNALYEDPFQIEKFDFVNDKIYVITNNDIYYVAKIKSSIYAILQTAISWNMKSWQIIKQDDQFIFKIVFNVKL